VEFVVQVFISDGLKHASIGRGEASRPVEAAAILRMTRAGSFLVKRRMSTRNKKAGAGGIRRENISMFYFTLYVKGSFRRDPSLGIVARDDHPGRMLVLPHE
jgi:hypothetical protein